jgi:3D (Asp-Asp-Asp) domain-containing protein
MFLLSRSFRRKLLATALAASCFFLLYDATVIDSRPPVTEGPDSVSSPAARMDFVATAYCKGQMTSAGVTPQAGIAAGDPRFLPEGSVIQLEGVPEPYGGIYTVMDTGPKVLGRHVDLYMWSCFDALTFGRRAVAVSVLRLGWSPENTVSAAGQITGLRLPR